MNKIARFSNICRADAGSLSALYEATSERTLAAWQQVPDCGEVMQNAHYDPHRLALATGIQPPLSGAIASLRQKLAALTGDDPLADCMPASGLHFTFLPVTLPLYEKGQRPQELDALRALWQTWDGQTTRIRGLRLVALPGQLLLAGIPDEASQRARQTFCETLLSSPWRDSLLARHKTTPLPPPFWHTTLLRYRAQCLPVPLRRFFIQERNRRYGDVAGPLILGLVNYNWTQVDRIK
ncbi:hypothetical protein [Metakosakonia massiliensis]|uniref:Uncharacterized protein n=1 Tax=Phytobacter massiliensis TaxID=1485952 RepID=A0A6N3CW77_9ENTR